jgi:predicted nucleotidyltransferase
MRISNSEKESIKKTFFEVFKSGEIYLFGSRTDDNKKGGDIDLFIVPQVGSDDAEHRLKQKHQFTMALEDKIGLQQIDVIIAHNNKREIEKQAIKTGIKL